MKKIFLFLTFNVLVFIGFSQNYDVNVSGTTLPTGTHTYNSISNWNSQTLTIPVGAVITFNNFSYGNGNLVISGGLTLNTSFGTGKNVVLSNNSTFTVTGTFDINSGAAVTVNKSSTLTTGTLNGNGGTLDVEGTVNSGVGSINSGINVSMNCPAVINAATLTINAANKISGTGFIKVTSTFTSWNSMTNSSTIEINAPNATNPKTSGKDYGSATLSTVSSCPPLSVNFERVIARFSDINNLNVEWVTLSETNSGYFQIEASKNGVDFFAISDKILSKNTNGNNNSYLININFNNSTLSIALAFLFIFLSILFIALKKIVWKYMIVALFMLATTMACTKTKNDIKMNNSAELFIRIKQVEKNSNIPFYSKIIKVANDF